LATLDDDIGQLTHSRSPKRKAAAKRLRKRADIAAGPALLAALRKEVEDSRTWETQYQMVMAIGECEYREALPFLKEFAATPLDATMIYTGVGDALVRLQIQSLNDGDPIIDAIESGNRMLINGAFRAMAMLKMVPSTNSIEKMLQFVSKNPYEHDGRFWLLAAAPGWTGDKVAKFVAKCSCASRRDIREAAKLALGGTYGKWNPL